MLFRCAEGLPLLCSSRDDAECVGAKAGSCLAQKRSTPARALSNVLACSPLADLVLADDDLMEIFEPLLRHMDDRGEPLFDAPAIAGGKAAVTVTWLTNVIQHRRCGLIVDETQKITEADGVSLQAFKRKWYGWQCSRGRFFVRMDIASSHGA